MSEDEQLVIAARSNGELMDSLISGYKNFIRSNVRSFFLTGGDRDDLMQEAMIGFYKAVIDYSPEKSSSFKTFASLCIKRQVLDAIKAATRSKHKALNTSVPLLLQLNDDGEIAYVGIDVDKDTNPETIFIEKESVQSLTRGIKNILKESDRRILSDYLNGMSYQQISEKRNKSVKYVDNSLQRIKKKIASLKEGE